MPHFVIDAVLVDELEEFLNGGAYVTWTYNVKGDIPLRNVALALAITRRGSANYTFGDKTAYACRTEDSSRQPPAGEDGPVRWN